MSHKPSPKRAPPGTPARRSRNLALTFGDKRIRIAHGLLRIGRSPECEIVIDDHLVSRIHARVKGSRDGVFVEDLESKNGALLNGTLIDGITPLEEGDRLQIGTTSFSVVAMDPGSSLIPPTPPEAEIRSSSGTEMVELDPDELLDEALEMPISEPDASASAMMDATTKANLFNPLSHLLERMVSEGQVDDAVEILTGHIEKLVERARQSGSVNKDSLQSGTDCAFTMARATNSGKWIDVIVELHLISRRPLRGPQIDKLGALLPTVLAFNRDQFEAYQKVLRAEEDNMEVLDRVLASRIQAMKVR